MVLVQRTHMEKGEHAKVDFHLHCHHIKKKPEQKKAQMFNMAHRMKKAQTSN
jgi:hypothetical protein